MSVRDDLAPLTERVGALHALRAVLCGVVLLAAHTAPDVAGAPASAVAALTAAYLVVQAVTELARRFLRSGGMSLLVGGVLIDAIYIVAVVTRTAGSVGVLAPLVSVHLVAVCLLVGYRSGLRVALWYTGLFFTAR